MKQVNFTHPGGFPLEQETLERLQTAYRSELYEAFKSHLGLQTDKNYIIAHSQNGKQGWAVIQQDGEGILYPIKAGSPSRFLKTTKTLTNLIYGDGTSQTAYTDYAAEYVDAIEAPTTNEKETINYYDLDNLNIFETVKNIKSIETDINLINDSYLPLNGSKAMRGDLDLGIYHLSKLDTLETFAANVRAVDFKFGSKDRRGKFHPNDYPGRALSDSTTDTGTSLTLNYDADWENTRIGGKVYLDNLNTNANDFIVSESSVNSLLLIDDAKQVTKSNNLLNSLLSRITKLEKEKSAAIPIGMIALWGKTAPFPEGWEEYVPLRERMPVGLKTNDTAFGTLLNSGGNKEKKLLIDELPPHYHHKENSPFKSFVAQASEYGNDSSSNAGFDNVDSSTEIAIGHLGNNYKPNGDALEQTVGNGQSFSILNPYRVVHFIEYTGRSLATTALTTPPNLIAQKVGATFVDLSWIPTYNNVGITNYLVYKDNVLFARINDVSFFTVNGLSRSSSYDFSVRAQDAAGNISGESNVIRVKTNLL